MQDELKTSTPKPSPPEPGQPTGLRRPLIEVDDVLHQMKDMDQMTQEKDKYQIYELSELDAKIIRQVEFYFGDYNLPKDKFMLEVMDANEGIKREILVNKAEIF